MKSVHALYQLSNEEINNALKFAKNGDDIISNLIIEAVKRHLDAYGKTYLRHSTIEVEDLSAKIDVTYFEHKTGEVKEIFVVGKIVGNNMVEFDYIEI